MSPFNTAEFSIFLLILVILLTGLNVVFYISQKREQPANKLKLLIIILFGISYFKSRKGAIKIGRVMERYLMK